MPHEPEHIRATAFTKFTVQWQRAQSQASRDSGQMVMAGPKVPPRKRVGALTGLIDVTPTILAVLDLEPLQNVNGSTVHEVWTKPVYRPDIFSVTDINRPKPQIAKRTLSHKLIAQWKGGKALKEGAQRYFEMPDPQELDPNAELPEKLFDNIGDEYQALLKPVIEKWQGPKPPKSEKKPPPSPEEFERLKALGYVDGPATAPTPE